MIREIINACLSCGTQYYTLSKIMEKTLIGREPARHKLWKLENAGLITRIKCWETPLPGFSKGRPTKEICYRNTARLKQKAQAEPRRRQNGWDKMWQTVRVIRRFSHSDLVIVCGQDINNVRYFVKRYRQFGYFRKAGKKGRETLWMLARNAGPRRPIREVRDVA